MKNKLPNKPSELLMVALEDLEKIQNDPKYEVYMSEWHTPMKNKCMVCMVGAVMARTLGVSINEKVNPGIICQNDEDTYDKLIAINFLRCGNIYVFFYYLGLKNKYIFDISDANGFSIHEQNQRESVAIQKASESPVGSEEFQDFKNFIASFIGILQAEGL